jgi:hypothetical protein
VIRHSGMSMPVFSNSAVSDDSSKGHALRPFPRVMDGKVVLDSL